MEIWLRENDSIHLNLPDIPLDSEDTMFDYHVTADGNHALIKFCHLHDYLKPFPDKLKRYLSCYSSSWKH